MNTGSGRLQVVLERVDPACSMYRYYVVSLEPSLFGETALVRHGDASAPWGASVWDSTLIRPKLRRSSRLGLGVISSAATASNRKPQRQQHSLSQPPGLYRCY
jgi:hypothetical protein